MEPYPTIPWNGNPTPPPPNGMDTVGWGWIPDGKGWGFDRWCGKIFYHHHPVNIFNGRGGRHFFTCESQLNRLYLLLTHPLTPKDPFRPLELIIE